MKKLLVKTCYFVVPFFLIFFFNCAFYKQKEGDLARLGLLYSNPTLKSKIKVLAGRYAKEKRFKHLSELYPELNGSYDVLTIGDSFSNQNATGYQNFLAHQGVSVLNVDFTLLGLNPIQALSALANGDFFDGIKVKYVVLQTVERFVIDRCKEVVVSDSYSMKDIEDKVKKGETWKTKKTPLQFFSQNTLQIPVLNTLYFFDERPRKECVYKVFSTKNMFSVASDRILFYQEDYHKIDQKNILENASLVAESVNSISKQLEKKGIKLLFLVAPDKYDAYYPYIQRKDKYIEPLFFYHYENTKKEYIDIPAYSIIKDALEQGVKDVYFYDDTHWSPIAATLIADSIFALLKNDERKTKDTK